MTELLYHYTTAAGFLGIVGSRSLWATSSNYLNDPSEMTYAVELVLRRAKLSADQEADLEAAANLKEVIASLERDYSTPSSYARVRESNAYITSFSKSDQHLMLWRNYSLKFGMCLGFDRALLTDWIEEGRVARPDALCTEEFPEDPEVLVGLEKNIGLEAAVIDVTYGDRGKMPDLERVLASLSGTGALAEGGKAPVVYSPFAFASVKHPSFSDEHEVRMIVRETGDFAPKPKLRVSPSHGLVPYQEISFPREALRTVTTCPGVSHEQQAAAIRAALDDGGRGAWSHVSITETGIPFTW